MNYMCAVLGLYINLSFLYFFVVFCCSGLCLDKQRIPTILKREDQKVDQLKTSSSSLPQVYVIFLDPSWETMQKVPGQLVNH